MAKEKCKNKRSWWFRGLKGFMKIFKRKPDYIFYNDANN